MGDVVEAVNFHEQISMRVSPDARTPIDELLVSWGWHPKQADRMLERAARKGLIDYGVSARTGWLTNSGKARLRELAG